jgi:membrane-associated HD superfamily phosphohydrolase
MSRLLIISHVKEGVSLAKRYKLPAIIVEGIEQHHGTSVIQYFYHRACQRAEENDKTTIKPEDYRYPGPKPRSTEMGILMLADSLEAASRSIDKNKPGQIDGLVNEIIDEKIRDGQLNHCALTMEQINAIRRSFIFSLNNMLHGRVAYPKKDDGKSEGGEQKDKEKEKGKGKSEEPRKPADEN